MQRYFTIRSLIFIFFLLSSFLCPAQSKIVLQDSTILKGEIIEFRDSIYTIETQYGILKIHSTLVSRVVFDNSKEHQLDNLKKNEKTFINNQNKSHLQDKSILEDIKDRNKNQINNRISQFKTKKMLGNITWGTVSIYSIICFIENNYAHKELANAINSGSTYSGASNIKNHLKTYEIPKFATILTGCGIGLSSIFIKTKGLKYKSSVTRYVGEACLFAGGALWYLGNDDYKSANEYLNKGLDSDSEGIQAIYFNTAGEYFSKASNDFLTSSILFGLGTLFYFIDYVSLEDRISFEDETIKIFLKTDYYTKTPLIGIKHTF